MNREDLFTVLIPHYNQQDLWKTAVQSVLKQDYPLIELIIVDDASDHFDVQEIDAFIQKYASGNLANYQILRNRKNLGTVKTLNYAHNYCNGYYILHFAADDCLYDEHVLSNFVVALIKKPIDVLGIYGRSLKCDKNLEPLGEDFLSVKEAISINTQTSNQQFIALHYGCIFPMGATAYIFSELKEYMPFSEEYFLHEDWPFFLKATRSGKRFMFANFPALLYRAGGVSRPVLSEISRTRKLLFQDYFVLHEREIFPFTQNLSGRELTKLLKHYDDVRSEAQPMIGDLMLIKRYKLVRYNLCFVKAFWNQLSQKQREVTIKSVLSFLNIILDFIVLIFLWKIHFYWFVFACLLLQVTLSTVEIILFRNELISCYKSMKYYLFSPYR